MSGWDALLGKTFMERQTEIEGHMISQATGKRFLVDCQDINILNEIQGPPKYLKG